MIQLVVTLMFAALAAFAVRAIVGELTRPLNQPWLSSGFAAHVPATGVRPVDLASRRNRARVGAMARQARLPQSLQPPVFAAAA